MSRIRSLLVALFAMSILVMSAGLAHADNLQVTDLTVTSPDKIEVADVDQVANVSYYLTATSGQGDLQQGCNAFDGSPAIVTINVPAGVTMVSPSNPFSLSNCGQANGKTVQFKSSVAGDYVITAVVNDSGSTDPASYNENPAKFTLHVNTTVVDPEPVDTTDPVIVANNMVVEGNTTGGATVPAYDVTVTDNDPNPVVTFTPPVGSFFALGGPHNVSVTAKDAADNESSAIFTVTVIDTKPPVFDSASVPGDITRYGWNGFFQPVDNGDVVNKAKAGQSIPLKFNLDGPATATWVAPTATDIVDANVVVTCDHASGSQFPQGTTTVTCTATDDSGNEATVTFDVTVVGGNLGTGIMSSSSGIIWGPVPPADATDSVEEYATSVPGLNYDPVAKQYIYVWKTDKSFATKSGTFKLKLLDGSQHTALFAFTK
jgi:hypothetical protein